MSEPPLTGEPLALDLVNTRPVVDGEARDLVATPADLGAWLALEADRLAAAAVGLDADPGLAPGARLGPASPAVPAPVAVTAAEVAAVRELRGHVAVAVDVARNGRRPPEAALGAITAAAAAAPIVRDLRWVPSAGAASQSAGAGAVVATRRRPGRRPARLAAALADAAIDLLADAEAVRKVRVCAAEGCVMLFLPAHPRRRWCSPTRCGNRARVARYYERHKGAGP